MIDPFTPPIVSNFKKDKIYMRYVNKKTDILLGIFQAWETRILMAYKAKINSNKFPIIQLNKVEEVRNLNSVLLTINDWVEYDFPDNLLSFDQLEDGEMYMEVMLTDKPFFKVDDQLFNTQFLSSEIKHLYPETNSDYCKVHYSIYRFLDFKTYMERKKSNEILTREHV